MASLPHFIVLYGGQLSVDGRLNWDSAGRCDVALRIAQATPDSKIIFSVGKKLPELREATIQYLTGSGWSKEKMLTPPKAHNTWEETKAALEILTEHHANEVTAVSSWYHLPRIRLIWKLIGFKGKVIYRGSGETRNLLGSLAWEILGFGKLFIRKAFHKTRTTSPDISP